MFSCRTWRLNFPSPRMIRTASLSRFPHFAAAFFFGSLDLAGLCRAPVLIVPSILSGLPTFKWYFLFASSMLVSGLFFLPTHHLSTRFLRQKTDATRNDSPPLNCSSARSLAGQPFFRFSRFFSVCLRCGFLRFFSFSGRLYWVRRNSPVSVIDFFLPCTFGLSGCLGGRRGRSANRTEGLKPGTHYALFRWCGPSFVHHLPSMPFRPPVLSSEAKTFHPSLLSPNILFSSRNESAIRLVYLPSVARLPLFFLP